MKELLTCPICGKQFQTLAAHIKRTHKEDPYEYAARGVKLQSDELRDRISEKFKKVWDDPEYRKMMAKVTGDVMRENWKKPGYKEKVAESTRESRVETLTNLWSNPETRSTHSERVSAKNREQWRDPEYREKMMNVLTENGINSKNFRLTRPHIIVSEILTSLGVGHINEHRIGRFRVDIYVPNVSKVIEVNGMAFHGMHDAPVETMSPMQSVGYQRDMNKLEYFGKDILFLWEDEIHTDLETVKLKILEFLGG